MALFRVVSEIFNVENILTWPWNSGHGSTKVPWPWKQG